MPGRREHVSIACVLCLMLLACDEEEGTLEPRGVGEAVAEIATASNPTSEDPFAEGTGRRSRARISKVIPPRTITRRRPAPATEPEAPARDWAAELRSAAAPIDSCAPADTELPERLRLRLEATISATGRVTRAYVSGGGAPSSLSRCVRDRLLAAHFSPPEGGAPHTVRTELVAERRPQAAPNE